MGVVFGGVPTDGAAGARPALLALEDHAHAATRQRLVAGGRTAASAHVRVVDHPVLVHPLADRSAGTRLQREGDEEYGDQASHHRSDSSPLSSTICAASQKIPLARPPPLR